MDKTKIFVFFWIFYLFWIFINNIIENLYLSLLFLIPIVIFFLCMNIHKNVYYFSMLFSIFAFVLWVYVCDYNLAIVENKISFIENIWDEAEFEIEIKKINKITDDKIVYSWKILGINNHILNWNINAETHISWVFKLNKWDIISFKSKIYRFEAFNNFEYEKYMISNWTYIKLMPYNYLKIWENNQNFISKNISDFRESILSNIKKIYTKEEAIFLGWILVWAREDMPEYLKNNFNNSWLTHIIAVSWFNITILIVFFWFITKLFPPAIRFVLISIAIILFTMLVWYNPPVIRAAIMWIIWYFIVISWRKWNSIAIILFTAMVMVTYSPLSINYDVSMHLSFLAVLWILYTNDFFTKKFEFLPNFLEIKTALCLTLSALVFTFPIMAFNFWQMSLVAPLTNVLVSWTIPIIMLISFLWLIIYYIFPTVWIIISFFSWILLKWDITIVNLFWEFRYSVINYDFWEYRWFLEFIFFAFIWLLMVYSQNKKKATRQ